MNPWMYMQESTSVAPFLVKILSQHKEYMECISSLWIITILKRPLVFLRPS